MNKLVYLLAGILVLSTSVGCTNRPANPIEDGNSLAGTPTPLKVINKANTKRPPTKTATISVEGEKTQINLKLYNQESLAFSTYYPESYFIPKSGGSGEGTGVRFYVNSNGTKNQDAYIHFFFPARRTSVAQLKNMINGKRGLIATNGWKANSWSRDLPYSWAKERVVFNQRKGNQIINGSVILGEYKGKAFYVITHIPGDYGDGFGPRANVVFQNLQFGG